MSHCPARVKRVSRRRRHALCFGLLLLLLTGALPGNAQARSKKETDSAGSNIEVSLKVCVSDETGRNVDVQPILFNSGSVINKRTEDGCYAAHKITLREGKDYFVAAISEDRSKTAFKHFTVPLQDKEQPLSLKLAKPDTQSNTAIEICARDEQDNPLTITEVKSQAGNAQFTNEQTSNPACYRVTANKANEYQLKLTARSKAASFKFSDITAGQLSALLSIIALASLVLTGIILIRYKGLELRQAQPESFPGFPRHAGEPIGDMRFDEQGSVVSQPRPTPQPTPTPSNEQPDDQPGATDAHDAEVPVTGEDDDHSPGQAATRSASAAATTSQALHNVEDIKAKYLRFARGDQVEHFYLTPSGASTASEMVEDAKVELLEQKGSYVAFRSGDNEAEAWVFPMPKMHFTSETFRAVFPHLTEAEYESGNIEPKRAVSPQPKSWKIQ